jgi:DNA-directed RNA polymerase subunit E'/Rpb7
MTTLRIINKKITLDPQYLDSNYKTYLLQKLKDNIKNECNKEYGYYLDLKRIVSIKDNNITSNSEIIFNVEFEVETLLPIKDKEFEGTICMIFISGVFVNIKNKLKVLLPITELKNYTYCSSTNTFISNNEKNKYKSLKKDDVITVKILDLKYSKKQFSCFGKII